MTAPAPEPRTATARPRVRYVVAATIALAVTIVFATVGDGVEAPDATGLRHLVVESGHTGVWALLTVAFAVAAVRARWGRLSNGAAIAAGVLYVVFLLAVFAWR